MKRDNLNAIKERDIDLLLDSYSKVKVEVPTFLKDKVMNRIEEHEQNRYSLLNNIMTTIQEFFVENRKPVIVLSLSLIVIILLSVGTVTTLLSNKTETNSNGIHMANGDIPKSDSMMSAKIYAAEDLYKSDELASSEGTASISVNGKVFQSPIGDLLTQINSSNAIKIKVIKEAVKIETGEGSYIIAYEGTSLKLEKNINSVQPQIHCYLGEGEIDAVYDKAQSRLNYYIETPSTKVEPTFGSEFNLSVFENKDSVLMVKNGKVNAFSNIKWNPEMTKKEKALLNKYVNTPNNLQKDDIDVFVMKDVISHSKYINSNYKRIIDKYIIASQ